MQLYYITFFRKTLSFSVQSILLSVFCCFSLVLFDYSVQGASILTKAATKTTTINENHNFALHLHSFKRIEKIYAKVTLQKTIAIVSASKDFKGKNCKYQTVYAISVYLRSEKGME